MSQECTTFLIDYSASMEEHLQKFEAYLEYSLFEKCQKARKTDYTQVVLANCSMEKNSSDVRNMFEVYPPTAPLDLRSLVKICERLRTLRELDLLENDRSYMLEALLAVGVQINEKFKKKKVLKQLVAVTDDLDGLDIDDDELEVIQANLDLRLILVYCGGKQFPDDFHKTKWGKLVSLHEGSMKFTLGEMLHTIEQVNHRPIKPVRVFQGQLRLGADFKNLESCQDDPYCMCINVEGYPATKAVTSLSRKQVQKTEDGSYIPLKSVVEYEIHEPSEKEDQEYEAITVSKDHIVKAFRYGADYISLPDVLASERIYQTTPGLDIRGFIDLFNVPRQYLCGESVYIIADTREGSEADFMAFSALVDAMITSKKLAIARYVQKNNSEVQMVVLCPLLVGSNLKKRTSDNPEAEPKRALVLCRLPFAEDERACDFLPFTNKYPKDEDMDAKMDQLVDLMDMDSDATEHHSETSWCSNSSIQPFTSFMKDSSLPLPSDPNLQEVSDPICIPAIAIHRQKQVLLDYFHQRFILGQENAFSIGNMADSLMEQIAPRAPKATADLASQLKLGLGVKLAEKVEYPNQFAPTDEIFDDDNDIDTNIPSLEKLLSIGKSMRP
ncbi:ATP-dependent DNA helicase YKU80 Ecym_2476 [Eremothecium cymbalariae DBVPG|uniref:ATP-dependent DNA helicase II subunit 2 n=1 Tax=Eremothecium cymbalariae (strain CBS 270.75 / DBVPG 7215 / KCTC 17166 / NRRL Y-17582) TaxID=931890 RepID=G8JPU2_ERECY|nr:Hypothetical protein Ecym_2476 [Eremothecium cymbalariae DBVPG\